MKKLLLLALALLASSLCIGQIEMPEVIPPSPNAASLGTYGQVPVGLFTGTPQISIPIHTLQGRSIAVPVSVNYGSNGIRVDEMASHLGLGWSLNAGGVITRTLRDDPDEGPKALVPDVPFHSVEMAAYLESITKDSPIVDAQPDIFAFNLSGFSGKFYLDENLNPVLLEPAPVKIERLTLLSDNDPLSTDPEFKITDSDGTIYLFGGGNASERSFNRSFGCGFSPPGLEAETAWHLVKIIHHTGEEINFLYDTYNYEYHTGITQTVSNTITNSSISSSTENTCVNKVLGNMALLTEITAPSLGKILFQYSDGIDTGKDKKLENIAIRDKNDSIFKTFDFTYQIIDCNLSYLNNDPDITTPEVYKKRLFLEAITEKDRNGLTNPPHSFEYIDRENMPPRLSYAQDYWGYFNGADGNTHLVNDLGYPSLFDNFNIVSDRNPNGVYAQKGLLKKVTYPTGGTAELFFESHTTYSNENQSTLPPLETLNFSTETNTTVFTDTDIQTVNDIPFTQKVYANVSVFFNDYSSDCTPGAVPDHHIKATFTVVDLATNQTVPFFREVSNANDVNIGTYIAPLDGDAYNKVYVTLQEGKSYSFELKIINACLYASAELSYYATDPVVTSTFTNKAIGGVRLQKVITNDLNRTQVKKYFYSNLDTMNASSGLAELPRIMYINSLHITPDANGNPVYNYTHSLSSNTMNPLYAMQSYHIGYNYVIESYGDDFQNGGQETRFDIALPSLPVIINEQLVPGTPYTNIFGTGRVLSSKTFKKENGSYLNLKETTNNYTHDNQLDKTLKVYSVRRYQSVTGIPHTAVDDPDYVYNFHVAQYNVNAQWHYLSSTTEKVYDETGQNPVETITNYTYDNPTHLQATRVATTNSLEESRIEQRYYPHDKAQLSGLSSDAATAIDSLVAQHRITELLQGETYEDSNTDGTPDPGELLTARRTNYKLQPSGLTLPGELQTLVGPESATNTLDTRIRYQSYDHWGNVREVAKEGGGTIVYIWGYGHQYPIAKIEGATYTEVSSLVANLESLSDADTDRTRGSTGTEGALRDALNNLRTQLPDALVSTYTYDPLIGLTSTTDASGYTMYYEYDSFNRLTAIRDDQGKLLSENQYHYKNQ